MDRAQVKWKGRKPGKYQWYEVQDTIGYYTEFEKKKILWPGISAEVSAFAFDVAGYYGNDNNQLIISDDLYLLGILNSHLMCFALKTICDKVSMFDHRIEALGCCIAAGLNCGCNSLFFAGLEHIYEKFDLCEYFSS